MRLGVERRAIGAPRHQAILDLVAGIQFAGQNPADHEQEHDHAQRDERAAAAWFLAVRSGIWGLGVAFCSELNGIYGEPAVI